MVRQAVRQAHRSISLTFLSKVEGRTTLSHVEGSILSNVEGLSCFQKESLIVVAGGGWPAVKGSNMELTNFGSIMGFAAELEAADKAFYEAAAASPACGAYKELMAAFARDGKKNEKNMLRARREHVTEMVLEPITDFTSEPFISDREVTPQMSLEQIMARALEIEEKAQSFYNQAAEKTKGLAEVSRVLAKTGKKRAAHKARLEEVSKPG